MKEWSTLKKLIWLRKINGGGGGSSDPLNTFTGAIVRFLAKKAKPIVKLEANFTPIQDLNGYDAPWPAGGGKNKFNVEDIAPFNANVTVTKTADSFTVTNNNSYTVSPFRVSNGDMVFAVVDGTYSISMASAVSFNLAIYASSDGSSFSWYDGGITAGNTSSTFVVSGKTHIKVLGQLPANSSVTISKFQLEAGSVTPYAPYSNICPISGHTDADVVRTGKNLFSSEVVHGIWTTAGVYFSHEGASSKYLTTKDKIPVKGGATYSVSFADDVNNPLVYYTFNAYKGDTVISSSSWRGVGDRTIIVPENADSVTFNWIATNDITSISEISAKDFQLELGSTASSHEAFSGTTVSISFGQTVYGGTLTVFEDGSGQIVATHSLLTKNTASMNNGQDYPGWTNSGIKTLIGSGVNGGVTGAFTNVSKVTDYYGTGGISANTTGNNDVLILNKGFFNKTQTDWIALAIDIQIVVALAEPITFTVSGETLETLVGVNTVWADTNGDLTIEVYGTEIN